MQRRFTPQAKPDRFVDRTLDRSVLWEMHTPQVIKPQARGNIARSVLPRISLWSVIRLIRCAAQILRDGFALVAKNGLAVTDDVSIVEAMGLPVFITQGEYTNLKVTTPEDMFIAERLLDEAQAKKQ